MSNQYATQAQLQAWIGTTPAPAEADRLLQRASDLLDNALRTWRYTTDANGLPTDPVTIAAFADAVCAQVEFWQTTQDEVGEMEQYETQSFEGVALVRGGTPRNPNRLAPRALERLQLVPVQSLTRGVVA